MDVFLNGDLTFSTSKIFLNVMRIKHLIIILFPDYTGGWKYLDVFTSICIFSFCELPIYIFHFYF